MKQLKMLIVFITLIIILFSGCSPKKEAGVTCPENYMVLGMKCCLDLNHNKICDSDERLEQQTDTQKAKESNAIQEEELRILNEQFPSQSATTIVSYVLDGDTIKLSTGETVRLIGINAPEEGGKCYQESKKFLEDFIFDKEIILEKDVQDEDQYGRLLRYVFADGDNVNYEIVSLGFAHTYEYGSNTKYSSQFEQAENEAKQNEGCLWKLEEINYIQDQCISIWDFHFNAEGDDNYNLNDEFVVFKNKCSYSVDMTDWTIKDETASHLYTVPSFTFQASSTFTLFTGTGTNTNSALYWGRTSGNYAAIWNNNGDTLFLRDSNGNLVLTQAYSGY